MNRSPLVLALLAAFATTPSFAQYTVNITGTHTGNVYGNSSNGGTNYDSTQPSGNTLNILGGANVTGDANGSQVFDTNAMNVTGNTVNVSSGATVSGQVRGGYAFGGATGANASNNTVRISGNTHGASGANASSTGSTATASNNKVIIDDGIISDTVLGGIVSSLNGSVASGNSITINGGTIKGIIYAGFTYAGSGNTVQNNNTVTINGGEMGVAVYGGYRLSTETGDVFTGNTLNKNSDAVISFAQNFEYINFGYTGDAKITFLSTTPTGAAGSPSVKLTNTYDINFAGGILGSGGLEKLGDGDLTLSGSNYYAGPTTISTGRLILTGYMQSPVTVAKGAFFTIKGKTTQSVTAGSGATMDVYSGASIGGDLDASGGKMNFYVPTTMASGSKLLTVTGAANVTGATVNVGIDGASTPLKAGDSIVLIDASSLTGTPGNTTANGTGMQGVSLIYNFDIKTNGNDLIASLPASVIPPVDPVSTPDPASTPDPIAVTPQTKALAEGYLSGLALIDLGLDRLSLLIDMHGRGVFAFIDGASVKYKTGSSVDVDSFGFMAGIFGEMPMALGTASLTGFFTYGNGDYDTYNSFSNVASVKGKGDSEYYGVGILGRFNFNGTETGVPYAEASIQTGRVETDFHSNDIINPVGVGAKYDTKSTYVGAHLGGGYVFKFDQSELDIHGKYLYARRAGDKVRLNTGDPVDFAAVESHRLRVGGRYTWTGTSLKPYAGLAYEHEFDGKAKAKIHGYSIDAPDMKGGSGIAEFGLSMAPTEKLSLDIGIKGYAGKREGVSGGVKVEYKF